MRLIAADDGVGGGASSITLLSFARKSCTHIMSIVDMSLSLLFNMGSSSVGEVCSFTSRHQREREQEGASSTLQYCAALVLHKIETARQHFLPSYTAVISTSSTPRLEVPCSTAQL